MALSKIDAANFLDGTLPDTNINNASLDNVTGLPAAIATGTVLQVVQGIKTTSFVATSATYVATGLTADITPSSTSSKILVLVRTDFDTRNNTSNVCGTVFRDSTNLGSGTQDALFRINPAVSGRIIAGQSISFLDSPSSTSTLTYELYAKAASQFIAPGGEDTATIQLLEIEG
jgi:hypothetical protein|tara:strand:- start:137 stop:658 length:522 start_codon:yes stop_codon:yes gene_type:complete